VSEIRSFRDLDAWKIGMDVVELPYLVTADFPDAERFGLVAQMRRAAVSIPSNVAEGQAVRLPRWALRYVVTAIGSSCEPDTQLEVAVRLRFLTAVQAGELRATIDRVQKLLYGLRREKERRLGLSAASAILLVLLPFLHFFA
jgi:four helix bundle protein